MKISDLMQAMSDAGAPMEAILIAVRAIEASESAITDRRAAERDRKRRQRAKDSPGTVTGQSRDEGGTVTVHAPLSRPPNENISNPPTHTPGYNTRARKGAGKTAPVAQPDGVSDQVWKDFVGHRKRKGADLTETAMTGMQREATKAGWPLESAISETITRGWAAFKADWVEGKPAPGKPTAAPVSEYLAHMMAKTVPEPP